MTDRGVRSVDSAQACPFVAFEDDREARATSPDHRHRCYAELVPSPRAAAHQEAYCLSSAFPVCPTFQDWARREAAHARGEGERPREAPRAQPEADGGTAGTTNGDADADAANDDSDPGDGPARHPAPIAELPIRRNPPRDWAAPPPWATGATGAGRTGSSQRPADDAPAPPTFLAGRSDESRGLAGSAADRLVGATPYDAADLSSSSGASDGPDDELAGLVTGRRAAPRTEPEYLPPSRGARRPTVSSTRSNRDRERERERDAIVGPAWERARRYEAYPTIRSRAGLPPIPRPVVMAGALVIAAVALFFLPALLGVGGDGGGDGPTARPSGSQVVASPSAAPTEPPEPTPQVYLIKSGDTLSTVASAFEITLEELLAANPQITDPDRVNIGDEITIPTTPPSEFTDPSAEPSAEAS